MSLFGKEYVFSTPLSEQDVRQVRAGDILYINGDIWSARSFVLNRFVEKQLSDLAQNSLLHNVTAELLRGQYNSMQTAIRERL